VLTEGTVVVQQKATGTRKKSQKSRKLQPIHAKLQIKKKITAGTMQKKRKTSKARQTTAEKQNPVKGGKGKVENP